MIWRTRGIVRTRKFTENVSDHPGSGPRLCIAGPASAGYRVVTPMQVDCSDTSGGGGGGRRKWDGMGREMKFSALSPVAKYIRTAGAENDEKM